MAGRHIKSKRNIQNLATKTSRILTSHRLSRLKNTSENPRKVSKSGHFPLLSDTKLKRKRNKNKYDSKKKKKKKMQWLETGEKNGEQRAPQVLDKDEHGRCKELSTGLFHSCFAGLIIFLNKLKSNYEFAPIIFLNNYN